MSKLNKLIQKFLARPAEVRFEDVSYILEAFGYVEVRSRGSHHSFENAEGNVIVIPKKGGKLVKRTYIEQVIRLLNLENNQDDN
jgi:predicted RNA binding protein YcfA (HicA-like mRNA interferase family)